METLNFKPKDTHSDNDKSLVQKSEDVRIEPPIPVEPVVNSNVKIKQSEPVVKSTVEVKKSESVIKPNVAKVKQPESIVKPNVVEVKQPEKVVKTDGGNTISKDAIKKEDEELDKRSEIEILEKLKNHENEEKKILAESKQILEELKGARQLQIDENKVKPVKLEKDLNSNVNSDQGNKKTKSVVPSNEIKNQLEEAVKDKMPFPLVVKEANMNKIDVEPSREKRDLLLTDHSSENNDGKEENCKKDEKSKIEDTKDIKNKNNKENVNVEN